MDRREFLKYTGAVTLDVVLSTTLLSSTGCDSKANYSGYNPSSDEAAVIRAARKKISEKDDNVMKEIYTKHGYDDKNHYLKFCKDFIVEIHPPEERYGLWKAKGRWGVAYVACKDDCKLAKEYSEYRKRPDLFPDYSLAEFVFVEVEETKSWEFAICKHREESRLGNYTLPILDSLKNTDKR